MNVLIDTHSLLWFLTENQSLSSKAKTSIEQSRIIYVPTIVLLELLYVLQKKDQTNKFSKFLKEIKNNSRYITIAVDIAVVEEASRKPIGLEMHDRIIVACAEILKVPVITMDKKIKQTYSKTIW